MLQDSSVAAELSRLRISTGALLVEVKLLRLHLRLARERRQALAASSDAAFAHCLATLRRYAETCCKAGFNPDQPRLPAGSPDGGQWTSGGGDDPRVLSDATPDNEWSPGTQYAASKSRASGHHFMPQSVFRKLSLPDETRKVFEDAKTGPLYYEGNNAWDKAHRTYRDAVEERFEKFIDVNGISVERMTPDQARTFLREIEESADHRIRNFNRMIRMRELIYGYRNRFIFRGNE
ncbi:MAG: hypothetical protein HXX10_15685 [Rhodoplanes sp.]|uniref:hypothetical protein n=1 Tax=Rhodoplanes sp. TaxID=1968906 RepID=UPI0017E459E2|nr:hypothetical protein [Rhodoplanes sp.]NVO15471.1 hypothetical protein [Rhodoplanes sp.]